MLAFIYLFHYVAVDRKSNTQQFATQKHSGRRGATGGDVEISPLPIYTAFQWDNSCCYYYITATMHRAPQLHFKSIFKMNRKKEYKYLIVLCIGLALINIHSHDLLTKFHFTAQDAPRFGLTTAAGSSIPQTTEHGKSKSTDIQDDSRRHLEELVNENSRLDIPRDTAIDLLKRMQNGTVVNKGFFTCILGESKSLLHSLQNVYHIGHPAKKYEKSSNPTVTIVGDIHGQYPLMLDIFKTNGYPSLSHVYIFNGDFTDKGNYSLQTFTALLILKLQCPECIHFTRGNHESRKYLKRKLNKQIMKHYNDTKLFKLALQVAYEIPLGIILDDKTLVMHAGISGPTLTIADLNGIPKGIDTSENELLDEIVWSDPQEEDGIYDDPRRGRMFGPDISQAFLDLNSLDRIIRGHDNVEDGYMVHHQGRVITVWSAPDDKGIRGSYVNVNVTGELDVHYFESVMEEE